MSPTEFTTDDRQTIERTSEGLRDLAVALEAKALFSGYQLSGPMGELYAALAKAQGAFEAVSKDRTNPHFRSKYADLASGLNATREALSTNGLALFYPISGGGGVYTIHLTLAHTSGASIYCPITFEAGKTEQETGSRRTYLTRYGVFGLLGIAGEEDDDGNAASGRDAPRQEQRPPAKSATPPAKAPQVAPKASAPPVEAKPAQEPKAAPAPAQAEETASLGPAATQARADVLRDAFKAAGMGKDAATRFARDLVGPTFPACLEAAGGAALCEKLIVALCELKLGDVPKLLALTPEVAK